MPSNPGTGPVTHGYSKIIRGKQISLPFAPKHGTLPVAGFKEYIRQYATGVRRLPPMTVPTPAAAPFISGQLRPQNYLHMYNLRYMGS